VAKDVGGGTYGVDSPLEPLRGLPLYFINMTGSDVSDLTPLADLRLRQFWFTPRRIKKGIAAIRSRTTLRAIGVGFSSGRRRSVPQFWAKQGAGEFDWKPHERFFRCASFARRIHRLMSRRK
jgi:hypothetical protein